VPRLVVLSDSLTVPPAGGDQIHLLSLARAVAPHLPTTVVAWEAPPTPAVAAPDAARHAAAARAAWTAPLVDGTRGPELVALGSVPGTSGLGRSRRYARLAWRWIDAAAPPGSVLWVRRHATALAFWRHLLPGARRRHQWVYDASSFLRLEYEAGARGRVDLLKAVLEERLWPRFDWIRTLCDPMRDYLIERGMPAERVRVLPVGAPRPAGPWVAGWPERPPCRLLYVGSASPWQGLDRLLEAMRLLAARAPALHLTVVGLAADHRLAAGAPGNVTFAGRLPHAAAAAVYREHDLFILPRPRVALTDRVVPMKLVEAATVGVPVLATDLAAVRWATGEGGAWLVSGDGPPALAAAIEAAVVQPERLVAIADRARRHAARFLWETLGAEIATCLRQPSGAGATGARHHGSP
jgi:glycosyltransferase involved in cell wall biosynthesis